jgi:hypothetical protein
MYTNLIEFTLHLCVFLNYVLGVAIGVYCFSHTIVDRAMFLGSGNRLGSGNIQIISTLVHYLKDNKIHRGRYRDLDLYT